jgi:gas vesicle protein
MIEEKKGVPPWAYLLGGVAVGAAVGVLFAPKKGSELRADIRDWTKRRSEEGKAFLARIKKTSPTALENAKERAQEAIAAVKERPLVKA